MQLTRTALDEGLAPDTILSAHLIPAIEEVGRRFGSGEIFLPELMKSAGAMQAATAVIRSAAGAAGEMRLVRGTVVIATVQGDIHDIGKNIVSMFLESNGYRVADLGRDVSARAVLEGAREDRANVVCLSALLTTTMRRMREVIELFAREKSACPVIVGGAAISREFARAIGAAGYGKDAVEAVSEVTRIVEATHRALLLSTPTSGPLNRM
ncbi:MAG: cobalamin-dependent protein [Firmicutes bacterium]|jgi:5-methyltetrahydrofolate--homocysteine methyltransferase|nr:cobalamin-dependent protein [Bacillota bacterium]